MAFLNEVLLFVFVAAILVGLAGGKPETVVKGFFDIALAIIGGFFMLLRSVIDACTSSKGKSPF